MVLATCWNTSPADVIPAYAVTLHGATLNDMNTEVMAIMISALQATSEALAEVTPLLPPERRGPFEEKTRRILVAKTELMLARDSAR